MNSYALASFLQNIMAYQIVFWIIDALLGAGLCFGPLKWRKGLLTTVAIYWGIILGALIGFMITREEYVVVLALIVLGAVILPILTYTVAGVNRFMLGFLVFSKLGIMAVLAMAEAFGSDAYSLMALPIYLGIVVGLFFMAWKQVKVSTFICALAFLGSVQMAQALGNIINQIRYGITGDISILFDPVELVAAVFGVELTDAATFIVMLVLMFFGIIAHTKRIKAQGYPLSTPVIVYETSDPNKNGKILDNTQFRYDD